MVDNVSVRPLPLLLGRGKNSELQLLKMASQTGSPFFLAVPAENPLAMSMLV